MMVRLVDLHLAFLILVSRPFTCKAVVEPKLTAAALNPKT